MILLGEKKKQVFLSVCFCLCCLFAALGVGCMAPAGAIISAARERMLGASLYLAGIDLKDNGNFVQNANPCSMCKRMIINAGIEMVYIRDDKDNYRNIKVQEYIDNDESLHGQMGY